MTHKKNPCIQWSRSYTKSEKHQTIRTVNYKNYGTLGQNSLASKYSPLVWTLLLDSGLEDIHEVLFRFK